MANIQELYKTLIDNKGLTLDNALNPYQGKGFAVASESSKETVIIESELTLELFTRVLLAYTERLNKDNELIGAWVDNGKVYFDCSEIVPELGQALKLGTNRNQIAVFCFESLQSLYIN